MAPLKENIHTAINAVMQRVGYVAKGQRSGAGYVYAGEAALIAALRPEMVTHGITVAVTAIDDVVADTVETKRSTLQRTRARYTVTFTHGPSGTSIATQAIGVGTDSLDKDPYCAATGAYKYALRQTFCIETGDDPDKYGEPPHAPKSPEAKQVVDDIVEHLTPTATSQQVMTAYRAAWQKANNGETLGANDLGPLLKQFGANVDADRVTRGAAPLAGAARFQAMLDILKAGRVDPTTATIFEEVAA